MVNGLSYIMKLLEKSGISCTHGGQVIESDNTCIGEWFKFCSGRSDDTVQPDIETVSEF